MKARGRALRMAAVLQAVDRAVRSAVHLACRNSAPCSRASAHRTQGCQPPATASAGACLVVPVAIQQTTMSLRQVAAWKAPPMPPSAIPLRPSWTQLLALQERRWMGSEGASSARVPRAVQRRTVVVSSSSPVRTQRRATGNSMRSFHSAAVQIAWQRMCRSCVRRPAAWWRASTALSVSRRAATPAACVVVQQSCSSR